MDDPTIDDNPLSVDQAMDLIGKWETHPGLLLAIFDASRKLRDEVELLRDKVQGLELAKKSQQDHFDDLHREMAKRVRDKQAMQAELDQLRAVVAQNNQSIAAILSRWIKPSTN
jgi:hypothetical protein